MKETTITFKLTANQYGTIIACLKKTHEDLIGKMKTDSYTYLNANEKIDLNELLKRIDNALLMFDI